MKLDRSKISENFEIPVNIYDEILDVLEEGLKYIKTELDGDTVYLVINNIIKDRYEDNQGYLNIPKEVLRDLTIEIIEGSGNNELLPSWTITQEEIQKIKNRKPISRREFYKKHY